MELGRSISFIFQDRSWISKILILGIMFFIPIIGWLLIGGYLLRLMHNVIDGDPAPLPAWDNWGGDLAGGLKALVVGLIWGIPMWILQGIDQAIDVAFFSFVVWIVGLFFNAVSISAVSDLARSGNIADALNMRPFHRVVNNLSVYAVLVIATFVFALVAMIGLIGFIIGVVFTLAIAIVASTHLGGQAYRISERMGTVAAPRF